MLHGQTLGPSYTLIHHVRTNRYFEEKFLHVSPFIRSFVYRSKVHSIVDSFRLVILSFVVIRFPTSDYSSLFP